MTTKAKDDERKAARAKVRRLLMYWGNAERTKTEKERQIIEVDEEIESQYDLRPQCLSGMPHSGVISDSTFNSAMKATRETKRLERKKQRLEDELKDLNYRAGLIEFEVLCLPPMECEVIKQRYVNFGVATSGYWQQIARKMHVSEDWAKALERRGVELLIGKMT